MNFRQLLERHDLTRQIFKEAGNWSSEAGVLVKESPLLDATIIEAPSSTKNKAGERDPKMHQTKKRNPWYCGMKAHIGLGAKLG